MEESRTIAGRLVARGRAPGATAPLYLIERLSAVEQTPTHRNLPAVSGVVEVDGRHFWAVVPPHGIRIGDLVSGKPVPIAVALERTYQIGEAMMALAAYQLLPGDAYRQIVWVGDRLLLDYPAALLQTGRPSFPAVADRPAAEGAVITLLAVLHATVTGKSATEPPLLFRTPSQFGIPCPAGLPDLLQEGLAGALDLPEVVRRLRELDAEQRLVRLFPSPVTGGDMARTQSRDRILTGRTRLIDWLIWLVCLVGGIIILIRWG